MQTRSVIIASFLALSPLVGSNAQAQATSAPSQAPALKQQASAAAEAARRDFARFVQQSVQTHAGTLPSGFPLAVADVNDLAAARIGYGFPVYSVTPQQLLAGSGELSPLLVASGSWRFIITLNQRPIGLATVERVNG